jgi:hypothetical protein
MSTQSTLADAVLLSKTLLSRYLAGFTDENHTRQAPSLPNHVAWTLGHLSLTMQRVAEKLDGKPVPPSDFAPSGSPPTAFNPESVAFGSAPAQNASSYPSLARCTAIFNAACDRLAAATRAASDAQLHQTTKWGAGLDVTLESLVARMVFHNGTHTGQIADLRRALGFKSIFS